MTEPMCTACNAANDWYCRGCYQGDMREVARRAQNAFFALDEARAEVERLRALLARVAGVTRRGRRYTDRHLEAAADAVVAEVTAAMRGEA